MPFSVAGATTSDVPRTGLGKTRAEAILYIASYVGGENEPSAKVRAGRALDAAVDRYNMADWKFKRKTVDLALLTGPSGTTYLTPTLFKSPFRARMIDASGHEQGAVYWYSYEDFMDLIPSWQGTGNVPLRYTAQNLHETGQIIINPELAAPLQYPTMRVTYHEWITKTTADSDRLNVPSDVEAAMLEWAVALATKMQEGASESATRALALAQELYYRIEAEYRSWPDKE